MAKAIDITANYRLPCQRCPIVLPLVHLVANLLVADSLLVGEDVSSLFRMRQQYLFVTCLLNRNSTRIDETGDASTIELLLCSRFIIFHFGLLLFCYKLLLICSGLLVFCTRSILFSKNRALADSFIYLKSLV